MVRLNQRKRHVPLPGELLFAADSMGAYDFCSLKIQTFAIGFTVMGMDSPKKTLFF